MRKKYPSQIRYEANNPAMTFRVKKEEKEAIQRMAEKSRKSVSDLVRMALLGLEKDFSEAYNLGCSQGYEKGLAIGKNEGKMLGRKEAKEEWAITVDCYMCKEPVYIEPNSRYHKEIKDKMFHCVIHPECGNL